MIWDLTFEAEGEQDFKERCQLTPTLMSLKRQKIRISIDENERAKLKKKFSTFLNVASNYE